MNTTIIMNITITSIITITIEALYVRVGGHAAPLRAAPFRAALAGDQRPPRTDIILMISIILSTNIHY